MNFQTNFVAPHFFLIAALFLLVDLPSLVRASKGSAWYSYPWGRHGNDEKDELYHRATLNVLHDVMGGDFTELYIQYHGCV